MVTWDIEGLVVALLNSTAVAGYVSWLAKKRFESSMKAALEEKKSALKIEEARQKQLLEESHERDERVRLEIHRWQNPIYGAVVGLLGRLDNILNDHAYPALSSSLAGQPNPEWSIQYDYFMPTTLFLFGQYFCWVELLRERLNFEIFSSGSAKSIFFSKIDDVAAALSSFPPKRACVGGGDKQVFRLQQRTLGEALIVAARVGEPGCIKCHAFLEELKAEKLNDAVSPLKTLLEGVSPETQCRWQRLQDAYAALAELKVECERALRLENGTA